MLRAWLATVAVLAGCDSIFGVRTVGGPPDAADAMIDAPILQGWKATASGWLHSCGIRADDTLWCWGSNEVGELGLGSTAGLIDKPSLVSADGFSEVSATFEHSCALGLDGAIRCWGLNDHGQLGVGNLSRGDLPRLVPGPWKHVSAGGFSTCAIRDDDTLWCWGWNLRGEVGIGTFMQTPEPAQVGTSTWLDVDVGFYHACGITANHAMWCWGYEGYGEFGNDDDGGGLHATPTAGPPGSWAKVQAGAYTTCGITTDSQLSCWGLNDHGQLGNGSLGLSYTPQPIVIDGKEVVDALSVSLDHVSACTIRQDGSLWCWGNDDKDQLGVEINDADGLARSPIPVEQVSPRWRRVDAGLAHTCAISGDNELYCVGLDARGELGNSATNHSTPHAVPLAGDKLAIGGSTTCGLDSAGTIHCAGYNAFGQLGDGTTRSRSSPVAMSTPLAGVISSAPGYAHTCASTGTAVYCWGSNAQSQLGNGNTTASMTPVVATAVPPLLAMASYNHTCGIDQTSGGSIYCWGDNDYGQVGDGSINDRSAPIVVGGAGVQIVVSPYHTCALVTSGVVYCWGRGTEGQLGLGDSADHHTAQPIPTTVTGTLAAVTAGWNHTCAIATSGRLYCWGANNYGQLGQGDATYRSTPFPVGAAAWSSVAAGLGHTCGVRTDGTLWCWGRNTRGQLGLGHYDDRFLPSRVGQDSDWTAVYAGDEHTCGVKATGQVSCWGANEEGQTPDGTAWQTTMVRVP